MIDQYYVYGTAAVILILMVSQVFRKAFDPFAPIWLFLVGYAQVYVIQAINVREWALRVRGVELVTQANFRAFWALVWLLVVYYSGLGRVIAARLPRAPTSWSLGLITGLSPLLITWGMLCTGLVIYAGRDADGPGVSAERTLFLSFPTVMLVAAILLIVTGRQPLRPRPAMTATGVAVAAAYVLIWMFFGRRSHALFGVLTGVCAFYVPRWRRPSLPVLAATAFAGSLVVALAIGWRGNKNYERSFAGFGQYVSEFDPASILVSLNIKDRVDEAPEFDHPVSYETLEYGGFLLMLDTVPARSEYDYGASYIRLVSTYIPRLVWHDKPYFGREQWVDAWIAGSELKRDATFTGPAIGILGATQLNGGAWGTFLVLGALGLLLRTAYDYFRFHAATPWAQAWWALTYYNAWLMTVNDDPFVWFYYLYGHTTLAPMAFLWIYHKVAGGSGQGPGGSGQWPVASGQ
jgi:hypothetical protein